MKILVQLGHPAQFHFFKHSISNWIKNGHKVRILIRTKDVLEELVSNSGFEYINLEKQRYSKKTKLGLYKIGIIRLKQLTKEYLLFKPKIVISPDPVLAYICKLGNTNFIAVGEDDYQIIQKLANYLFPNVNHIVSPRVCDYSLWQNKKIEFEGYMKLAYLHPNQFIPNRNLIKKYVGNNKYIVIRLVSLTAHHDDNVNGIDDSILNKLIEKFTSKKYDIYISSEKQLKKEYEKYRINIPVELIHHAIAFSSLVICDSQSMAVESAMLGVPSIRYNDFAGKISVLEELESKYGLTFGINTQFPEKLFETIEEMLNNTNIEMEFTNKRQQMLAEKIDVTAFFTWFIENYPESADIMRKNPDYQYKFK